MVKLLGSYLEIYKVTDPSGANTEVKVAETRDDVEVNWNVETRETKVHGNPIVYKQPSHWGGVITFGGLLTSTLDAWETLGFKAAVATDTPLRPFSASAPFDALRIKVYAKDSDTTPIQTLTALDVVVKMTDFNYPIEDFAAWSAECDVRGAISIKES